MVFYFTTPINQPMPNGADGEIMKSGHHILDESQLRDSWFTDYGLEWNDDTVNLPEPPNGTLLRIRGTDIPQFPRVKKSNTPMPTQKALGTLLIVNMNKDGTSENISSIWGGPKSNVINGNFKFSTQLDTQLPSLTMEYKIRQSAGIISHRIVIHGNTKLEDAGFYSPESVKSGNLGIDIPEAHQEAAKDGRLLALTIDLGKSSVADRAANGITVLNDHKIAGDEDRLPESDRWTSTSDMFEDLRVSERCSGFDNAVGALYFSQDIRLVFMREINSKDDFNACMTRFLPEYTYWAQVMKLSIQYGPFWFYTMQRKFTPGVAGAFLTNWDKPKNPPPVPFWCIKQAEVKVIDTQDTDGTSITSIEHIRPIEWAPIVRDPTSLEQKEYRMPHPDSGAFLHELSLLRERAWQFTANFIMFQSGRLHPTTIRPSRKLRMNRDKKQKEQNFCSVEIFVVSGVEEGTENKAGVKILPEPGTSIVIEFCVDGTNVVIDLGGKVSKGEKGPNVDLLVICQINTSLIANLGPHLKKDSDGLPCVQGQSKLKVIDNFESIDRQLRAFREITRDQNKDEAMKQIGPHPDPRSFLLKYEARWPGDIKDFPADIDAAIADYIQREMKQKADFSELCKWLGGFSLNNSQLAAIKSAIKGGNENGDRLVTIIGPPGTGKSHTLAALVVVLAHVFNCRIAVTAPSNQACDAILEKIVEAYNNYLKPKGIKWNIVRFLSQTSTPMAADVKPLLTPDGLHYDTTGLDQIDLAVTDSWKSEQSLAYWTLFENKKRFANDVVTGNDKAVSAEVTNACKDWWHMFEDNVHGLIYGEENRIAFAKADDLVSEEVMKRCNLIVGTMNSQGRKDLTQHCPVDTLIMDECAQALLVDCATAVQAYEPTLKRCIACGDDKQLPAFLSSERANETGPFVQVSVFKEMRLATDKYPVHLLNIQYRCHEDLYRYSNDLFYDGQVTSYKGNRDVTGVDRTVAAFLEQQIGHMKNKRGEQVKFNPEDCPRFIAVDINQASSNYPGSVSPYNKFELEFTIWLRGALLKFTPPSGGAQLTPEAITMITAYRGQVAGTKSRVKDQGIVSTVMKSQGSECVVGISSFAKNDPHHIEKLGFITRPPILNVWMTRQKRFHFVTGPWSARYNAAGELYNARHDNASLLELHDYAYGDSPGTLVVRPIDFRGWTGYPKTLEPLEPPQPRTRPPGFSVRKAVRGGHTASVGSAGRGGHASRGPAVRGRGSRFVPGRELQHSAEKSEEVTKRFEALAVGGWHGQAQSSAAGAAAASTAKRGGGSSHGKDPGPPRGPSHASSGSQGGGGRGGSVGARGRGGGGGQHTAGGQSGPAQAPSAPAAPAAPALLCTLCEKPGHELLQCPTFIAAQKKQDERKAQGQGRE